MRYELADYEWIAIKPILPNKPRGVPRVNDRRVIPPKRNRNDPICFSPYLYRARNRVERFFNRIKQCRRVATRYDRLADNYLALVQLASIRLWLRLNESAS
jgi:transposase